MIFLANRKLNPALLRRVLVHLSFLFVFFSLSACALIPQGFGYTGPEPRTEEIEKYYSYEAGYGDYLQQTLKVERDYRVTRIELESAYGLIVIDYFQRNEKSENLIFAMPILGGSNLFANYIAEYMCKRGFDAAVVHRDAQFKRPENFERIEELFRDNVKKDRLVMDFFEAEFEKREFGSFGISRGAINAAITAGVDPRLKYNVLAIGGADLVNLFRDSKEHGIKKYRRRVMKKYDITEDEFYGRLEYSVRTDPKYLAKHIDARNTLMFLALFDQAVPVKYGLKLKRRIGHPTTVFLVGSHYSTIAFTQFVRLAPPIEELCIFPLDFIETESLAFYREKFGDDSIGFRHIVFSVFQAPIKAVAGIVSWLSD